MTNADGTPKGGFGWDGVKLWAVFDFDLISDRSETCQESGKNGDEFVHDANIDE